MERHQRAQDADHGHARRQDPQNRGDRERAVEDLERGLTKRAVRADQEVLLWPGAGAQGLDTALASAPGATTTPREETPRSSQLGLVGPPAHHDDALIRAVVGEDTGDRKGPLAAVGAEPQAPPTASLCR